MSQISANRVMLTAPRSGSGKTTITCALLELLKNRGMNPFSFKCGPDFIDPQFHRKVLGINSSNLDVFFSGANGVKEILSGCGNTECGNAVWGDTACRDEEYGATESGYAEFEDTESGDKALGDADSGNTECGYPYAVIEGVMGVYDGMTVTGIEGSAYEIAAITKTPIILITDASGVGRTVISMIKGVLSDDTQNLIRGIILNKISESFYFELKPVLEKELSTFRGDVRILGYFPKNEAIRVGSRHLGLLLPSEIEDIKKKIGMAADDLERTVDMAAIISIMREAEILEVSKPGDDGAIEIASAEEPKDEERVEIAVPEAPEDNGRIEIAGAEDIRKAHGAFCNNSGLTLAVAYDDAFNFYYSKNLALFEECGVTIKSFSPLRDEGIPKGADGILIGGGYPENHLEELSRNTSMLQSIRDAIAGGIPLLAECGGFMYLHRTITDRDRNKFEMVGAIDGDCFYTGRLVRFGYLEVLGVNGDENSDSLPHALIGMRGHEFHYYDSTCNGAALRAGKPYRDRRWDCVIASDNGIWGFPHFYYGSKPEFVMSFIERMRDWSLSGRNRQNS